MIEGRSTGMKALRLVMTRAVGAAALAASLAVPAFAQAPAPAAGAASTMMRSARAAR
jgi:hypothetical protein